MSDELRIEYLSLSALRRYPRNPKDHDLGLLHESIARFGFKDPMAIDEVSGELVEGHGRLDTLERQQLADEAPPKHIKVVNGEWFAPVVRGLTFDSDDERRAYTIGHNRTTEMGGWHEELLLDELKRLAENEVPLEGTGYDLEDLDRMLSDAAFADAPPLPEPSPTTPSLSERFGVRVDVATREAEDALVDMLAERGIEAKRLSE